LATKENRKKPNQNKTLWIIESSLLEKTNPLVLSSGVIYIPLTLFVERDFPTYSYVKENFINIFEISLFLRHLEMTT
jgi:hypothetical protein